MGENENQTSIYDFTVKDTYGNDVKLDKYRDKVVLVVNTASQCGLASNNYDKLTKLKQEYESQGEPSSNHITFLSPKVFTNW